jgi:hypothetical protein
MFMILAIVSLLVIGLLAFSGRLSRFGRLPGDIQYRGARTRVYAPITLILLLSLLLSLVLTLLSWLL